MALKCVVFIFLSVQIVNTLKFEELPVNSQLSILAEDVIEKYFFNSKCVTIIRNEGVLNNIRSRTTPIIQIKTNEFCTDENSESLLISVLDENCPGFIVHITNPECFMPIWTRALFKTNHRPNPQLFFLPVVDSLNSSVNIAEEIYSKRETEITQNILVAEYNPKNQDWPVQLYTNNFNVDVGTEGRIGKIFLDRWNMDGGFEFETNLYPDKMLNMNGKILRVFAFDYPPYAYEEPVGGFEVDIMFEFCRRYNCTVKGFNDGVFWGNVYENGTGDGIMGMVYTDKVDMGVAAYYLWIEGYMYIDYSNSYLAGAVTLLVPKPTLKSSWTVPFQPFDISMWITYIISIALATIFMTFVTIVTMKYTRFTSVLTKKKQFVTVTDSVFRIIGMSVLQQPSIPLVPHTPIRHLFTSFECLYLVLTTIYAAELASVLTIPQYTQPMETLHDLAVNHFPWAGYHDGFVKSLRTGEDDPDAEEVVSNFHLVPDEKKLSSMAATQRYGLPLERCPSGHFSEHFYISEFLIENTRLLGDNLFGSPLVTVLRKAGPYAQKYNDVIGKVLNSGLLIHWEEIAAQKYLSSRKQMAMKLSRSKPSEMPTNLKVAHIQGVLMIYACGLTVSFTAFFYELCKKSTQQRKLKEAWN